MSHNSSEEFDEMTSINGELYVLFSERTRKQAQQWRENVNKIIGLLSRKINLMKTHSRFDIGALCKNVQFMEEGILLLRKCSTLRCDDGLSNADAIRGETQFLQNMQELRRILIYFEQHYGVPTLASTEPLQAYLKSLKHHYQFKGYTIKQIEELKEFQKHEKALTDVISEIFRDSYGIYRNDIHCGVIAIIDRYIKNLNALIYNINLPADQIDERLIRNLDRCVLNPGCGMFDIPRGGSTPEESMTPMEILTQLKMKAERLLQNETMVINWEKHEKQKKIWMDASIHKGMANKAKALLTETSIPITNEDLSLMLARGGIMKSLVDALVQQPTSQRQPKLKHMILNRISKQDGGGSGTRKTKRRHKRSRRRK